MIDIGRGFKAPFEDKDWISKTLLGFLWGLLGVTAPAVSGAQVEYIRTVSRGDDTLPTWDDFGKKWVEGLLVFAAGFLYFLPVIVLGALFAAPVIVSAIVSGGDSDALGALFAGGFCFFWIVALVYIAGVSVLFSAAMTNYAMKESFGAFFALGEIMELVRGNTGYLTAWFYTLVIGFAGSAVASILSGTGVGAILAPAITYLVAMMSGNILGQWAAQAYQTTPQPASAAPAVAAPAFAPPPPAPPAPAAPPAASSAALEMAAPAAPAVSESASVVPEPIAPAAAAPAPAMPEPVVPAPAVPEPTEPEAVEPAPSAPDAAGGPTIAEADSAADETPDGGPGATS